MASYQINVDRFSQHIHTIYKHVISKSIIDTFVSYVRSAYLKEENDTLSTFVSELEHKIRSSGHSEKEQALMNHLLKVAHSLYTRRVDDVLVYTQDPERTIVLYRPTLDEALIREHVHATLLARGVPVFYVKWGDSPPEFQPSQGGHRTKSKRSKKLRRKASRKA